MVDITGMQFGSLQAIKPSEHRTYDGAIVWECVCTCDRINCAKLVLIRSSNLRSGQTTSCRRLQHANSQIHRAIYVAYDQTRANAKARSYPFELTPQQFHALIRLPCHYCGNTSDIKNINSGHKQWRLRANGIDRKDNTLGYIESNCVSCCERCNRAKGKLTVTAYIELCHAVVRFNP